METVKPIASEEYRCGGWTPLYDAIGCGIGILDEATEGKVGAKAILVIMTDGQENASCEFSHEKDQRASEGASGAGMAGHVLG